MRALIALLFTLLPVTLWANCGGTDLRETLTDAQQTEIDRRIADAPYATGNHWRATKGDQVIHLIGTMHIDDPRMDALAARLALVVETADLLMVEATEEDQKQLERDMALTPELAFLTGETLIDLMPPEDWAALAAAAEARGIPGFMAAKFQPWYLSLMLSMSPCEMRAVASGQEGLDARIIEIAAQAGVPTRSLEDPKSVFQLFNQDPIEDQIALLTLGILPDEASENASYTLKQQYFDEETLAALELSRVVARPMIDMPEDEFDALFDEFIDLLLRVRNEAWMDKIDALEEARVVIASGALHLAGEYGLPNLLEQRGYTLERQPF
ncbi:MAG: TraB/GumN family protein [Pseudomonadota bacterium]